MLSALWQVGHPDAEDSSDRDHERADFDDRVSDLASFKMFCNAWWPAVSAPASPGWPMSSCSSNFDVGAVGRGCELLSASYRDATDWTAADGALLDELVHLLGPPVLDEEDVPGLSDLDSGMEEVFTTADLLSPAREADPFELPHETYAHLLVDEAQDLSPMQWRMLRRVAPARAGPSWATLPRAPGQTQMKRTERSRRSSGPASTAPE